MALKINEFSLLCIYMSSSATYRQWGGRQHPTFMNEHSAAHVHPPDLNTDHHGEPNAVSLGRRPMMNDPGLSRRFWRSVTSEEQYHA